MHARRWILVLIYLTLATPACPSWASEGIRTSFQHSTLSVYLPGSYRSFDAFRAPSPDGPWTVLTANNTNCLEGCGWNDQLVDPGATYYYRFEAIATDGARTVAGPLGVQVPLAPLAPRAWPNPSRGAVRFEVQVPPSRNLTSRVQVAIFDATGRRLRSFPTRDALPGSAHWDWDGLDDAGRASVAGVYFYRVQVGSRFASGSLVRVR